MNTFGYTLIELLVTISVLIVIAGMTIPAYGNFIQSNSLKQSVLDITTDVELLKSKALSSTYISGCSANNCKANWGIEICTSRVGGPYTENTKYILAPYPVSGSWTVSPTPGLSDYLVKTLPAGVTFSASSCDATAGGPADGVKWVFGRLSGLPVLPINSYRITLEIQGQSKVINLNSTSGQITY